MTEMRARKELMKMLRSLTPGSIMHLLAEALRRYAEEDIRAGDEQLEQQIKLVEATLFVVGMGIDAALPR